MASKVATVALTMMSTQRQIKISLSFADGLKTILYTFLANIELAESMDESVDDMTAALIPPRPTKETHCKRERKKV